jgi:quaternary ammonium compound-resistance protein SugE
VVAGLFEVGWAVGLKYTAGFSRWKPTLFTIFCLAISMLLLARAAAHLPIGTAYGVWVGIGALGTAILGIYLFKEPVTLPRVFFLLLLLISIVGLKLSAQGSVE